MSDTEFPSPYYRKLQKAYDKARFDCFKEHLGCQNADDVYNIVTTYAGIERYNGIVGAINSRIAAYTGCSYSEFRNVEQWRTPQDRSEELLEYIRKRWDEIYNDEPVVDQKPADANPVPQTTSDSKIFDTDHFPIGSAVLVTNLNCKDICIPDKEAIGIVYNIDNDGKNLILAPTTVTVGTPLINVRIDQVEQELVKLTRLLPEPPEVENMDYQSALNEMGFVPTDLVEDTLKAKLNQPSIPAAEFAERLIALEQENVVLREELEQLKEVVSLTLSLTNQSLPVISQYHGGGRVPSDKVLKKWYQSIWEWAHNHGVDDFPFDLTPEGLDILPKEERSNDTGRNQET